MLIRRFLLCWARMKYGRFFLILLTFFAFAEGAFAANDCQSWLNQSRNRGQKLMNAEENSRFQKLLGTLEREVKLGIDQEASRLNVTVEKYLSVDESVMALVSQVMAAGDANVGLNEGEQFCEALRLQIRLKIQSDQPVIAPSLARQRDPLAVQILDLLLKLQLKISA
jgi:hypothetical protein